jgi:hypothetical protein
LCSHTNSTSGNGFSIFPSAWATAHSRSRERSMMTGRKFGPTVGRSPICSYEFST